MHIVISISSRFLANISLQASEVLPLFLIDSEGMGVRGDAFDFITTSPPAVIAKVRSNTVSS